ncbi:hypothetical protein X975_24527, partial [Stegodyphus mimosarum]
NNKATHAEVKSLKVCKMALLKSCCCWKSVRSGSFAS